MMANSKPTPTFEVRFVGLDLSPEKIPLRAVGDALSAVQDLASGRDPMVTLHVPQDKGIGLVKVRRGSAVYDCVSRAPQEAIENLERVGSLLAMNDNESDETPGDGDVLIAALRPIESLSAIAKALGCRVEVALAGVRQPPVFIIEFDAYSRLSSRLLLEGETTIVGKVERVGGATGIRCALRIAGRRRILYCNVETHDKELVRRLGQCLYEDIVATGTATWIHRTWHVYKFTIRGFSQPRLGNSRKAIEELRSAGLKAWDQIDDPEGYIKGLRS